MRSYVRINTGCIQRDLSCKIRENLGNASNSRKTPVDEKVVDSLLLAIFVCFSRAVARALIGGVYIHIFRFCPTSFF